MAVKKGTIKYLDVLWRKAVKLKWNYRSFLGGKAEEVHHIVHRTRRNTRWDIENGCPLTLEQHNRVNNQPGYEDRLRDLFGRKKYEELDRRSHQYFDKDYDRIKNMLKEALNGLNKKQKQ